MVNGNMVIDNMVMFGSYLGIGNIWVITIIISVTDKVVFALRYKILTWGNYQSRHTARSASHALRTLFQLFALGTRLPNLITSEVK